MDITEFASKGGKARSRKLSDERKKAIASKAINSRWANTPKHNLVFSHLETAIKAECTRCGKSTTNAKEMEKLAKQYCINGK